jgi:hypothetical protein
MACCDQGWLKGDDLEGDPGDQVQNSRPHVRVLEIGGDDDGHTHMIRIPVTVLIGKEELPFPKSEEVMWERLRQRHDFNLGPGYK